MKKKRVRKVKGENEHEEKEKEEDDSIQRKKKEEKIKREGFTIYAAKPSQRCVCSFVTPAPTAYPLLFFAITLKHTNR